MINNTCVGEPVKLKTVKNTVFMPQGEDAWYYSHHQYITFWKGRFYATWSNGKETEDSPGQRIMLAVSADGLNWTDIHPVAEPAKAATVLTSCGFYDCGDTLNLYYGSFDYKASALGEKYARPAGDCGHENTGLFVMQTSDGRRWSAPQSLGLSMVSNHAPQRTRSGRLIISGSIVFPYTDSKNGIDGYRLTGIYGNAFGGQVPVDDSESIHHATQFNGWNANLICEGSFYQTDDSVLRMLLRSNSNYLWVTESRDDGMIWSAPVRTDFSNDNSKFHCGRLPDGRFYCVCNAKTGGGRRPLDLFVSENGEDFDRHYIIRDEPYSPVKPNRFKGGCYGYPHTLIHGGNMYVIYSKGKECVELSVFDIGQL